jgi:hypothetical protein
MRAKAVSDSSSFNLSHASIAIGIMTRSDVNIQTLRMSIVIQCLPEASVTTDGAMGNLRISTLPAAQTPKKRMGARQ